MRRQAALLVFLVAPPVWLAAQPAFRSSVEVVTVPVTVTGPRGSTPHTLTATDFRVFENGAEQQVEWVTPARQPHSICIVMDTSGSMSGSHQQRAAESVMAVVNALPPDDEFAVITFARTPVVTVPWTRARARDGVRWDVRAEGGTSIVDAVSAALALLESAAHDRRAILLVTDGFETSSVRSLGEVARTRAQSEVSLYAFMLVGLGPTAPIQPMPAEPPRATTGPGAGAGPILRGSPTEARDVIATLVGDSGGRPFRIFEPADAAGAAAAFIAELDATMTIGYTPLKAFDGKYRRLKVEIRRRGFNVRHRGGYLALPAAP